MALICNEWMVFFDAGDVPAVFYNIFDEIKNQRRYMVVKRKVSKNNHQIVVPSLKVFTIAIDNSCVGPVAIDNIHLHYCI